jgi:hypothetical protein
MDFLRGCERHVEFMHKTCKFDEHVDRWQQLLTPYLLLVQQLSLQAFLHFSLPQHIHLQLGCNNEKTQVISNVHK